MLDKIAKNNKIMALVAIATLGVVCYFLYIQKNKDKKDKEAKTGK